MALSPKLKKKVCIVCLTSIAIAGMFTDHSFIHIDQFPDKVLALSVVNVTFNQNISNANATNTTGNNRTQLIGEPAQSKIEPKDLYSNNLTTEIVKGDLSRLAADEIARYPLKDLSSENLGIILSSLPIKDLEKTLNSIKADDLREVLNKLPQEKIDQILNRLPQEKIDQILNRISPYSDP